jgi:hypothetical protein
MKTTKLKIDLLEECPRVQVRARTDSSTVEAYADALGAGAILPPPVVFREKGTQRYIIADGLHRLGAHRMRGDREIDIDLREGDETAALEFALSANTAHGLRRSPSDLKRCVNALMTNGDLVEKYKTHKDRSELLRVSERTFQSLIAQWRDDDSGSKKERKAKETARVSAKKHTAPKKSAPKAKPTEPSKPAPKADKSPRPPAKPQQVDTGWTKKDEEGAAAILEALEQLGQTHQEATRAAQIQVRDAVKHTLQSMLA